MMMYIYDGHEKDLEKMTRIILQSYLFEYKKKTDDIKSYDFLSIMRTHYKKQTSTNENLNELKAIIDNVISGSGLSKRINRAATLNDCKKAFLLYVLFFIQRSI